MARSRDDKTVRGSALNDVRFGVVATVAALRDEQLWSSLARVLGAMWSVRAYPSYADLAAALASGDVHLAWLPPLAYVLAARAGQADLVLSLERAGEASYAAALVVRDAEDAFGLEYVIGRNAAWVDGWSASGYLVPRRMLRHAGIDPDVAFASQQFVGSHSAVIEAVISRRADVAGTYCSVQPDGVIVRSAWTPSQGLRALAISDPIPGDTICISPKVGALEGRTAAARLLTVGSQLEHRALFLRFFGVDRFVRADPSRYAALEQAIGDDNPDAP